MKKFFLTLAVLSFVLQGCDSVVSQYLCFDDINYISDFPKEVELEKTNPVDIDLMGCVDFFGNDSVLVFKMMGLENHWKVCRIPELEQNIELLRKGNGPDEFVNMPSNEYFHQNGNVCQVWSSSENKIYHINLSKSFDEGKLKIDTICDLPFNGTVLNCVSINDSSYYAVFYQFNSYRRCILKGNELRDVEHLKKINDVKIHNDLNSMAAVRCYEPSQKKVVEGYLNLNQINLYSLEDKSFTKTICVGEGLTDLGRIDGSSKKGWIKYYGDVFTDKNYFAALYFDASREDYFSGKLKKTNIQFYSWNGEPLLNIILPYQIESFFIHKNKDLYILSTQGKEEMLYKYDLGDLLKTLQ